METTVPRCSPLMMSILCFAALLIGQCIPADGSAASPEDTPPLAESSGLAQSRGDCTYVVLRTFPHDPEAFTQGLTFDNGTLYESTGLLRRSTLRKVDLESGAPYQIRYLPDTAFGEGIEVIGDRVIQLTWQNKVAYVYDKNTLDKIGEFSYDTEGWGITHDGARIIMSDGSSRLYFRDPHTFEQTGMVTVRHQGSPVRRLNELEYAHGEVLANVFQTDRIARINPDTGNVTGWIHLDGLLNPQERRNADVLNGIAYDAGKDRLFVTGKLWPKLFQIRLVPIVRP